VVGKARSALEERESAATYGGEMKRRGTAACGGDEEEREREGAPPPPPVGEWEEGDGEGGADEAARGKETERDSGPRVRPREGRRRRGVMGTAAVCV